MSTNVTFNGTTYSIPASGELNWSSLSTFLIDVGNNANPPWQAFVPTFAGMGTVSNVSFFSQLGGKTLRVRGSLTTGTTIGATSAIILTGYTVDSSKLSTATLMAGILNRFQTAFVFGTIGSDMAVFYDGSTTDRLFFANTKSASGFTKVNGSSAFASSEPIALDFSIVVT